MPAKTPRIERLLGCVGFGAVWGARVGTGYGSLIFFVPFAIKGDEACLVVGLVGGIMGFCVGAMAGFVGGLIAGSLRDRPGWTIGGAVGGLLPWLPVCSAAAAAEDAVTGSFMIQAVITALIGALTAWIVSRSAPFADWNR